MRGFTITRRDIERIENAAHHHGHHGHRHDPGAKSHSSGLHKFLRVGETVGTAFALGVLKGRYGDNLKLGPVPADALGFTILLGSALMGWGGDHTLNVAAGFGASVLNDVGVKAGQAWGGSSSSTSASAKAPRMAGYASPISGALGDGRKPLTAAELAAIARQVR